MNALIFIVGNSRSGTTPVSHILKKHPEIYILNETHFMEKFSLYGKSIYSISQDDIWKPLNQMLTIQRKDYYRKSEYEEYPKDAKEIISVLQKGCQQDFATMNKVFSEFEAKRHGKKWAGDQTPRHVFYIRELIDWYPEARFIQIIRNPCAVLLSRKKNGWQVFAGGSPDSRY